MKHKNSHFLVGYWNRLRKDRVVPDQNDIDPRAIKGLLTYTFILDCVNPARPIYRLAGTALCERFGFELRGTSFLAHWETKSGTSLASLLHQALKTGHCACLSSVAATGDDGMVELETILTPVTFNGAEPTRFFGLVQMLSDPRPLKNLSIVYERLVGLQFIQQDAPPQQEDDGDQSQLPAPPPPSCLRAHPKAPYIRLVVSRESAPSHILARAT
jgi:hypothetical protein